MHYLSSIKYSEDQIFVLLKRPLYEGLHGWVGVKVIFWTDVRILMWHTVPCSLLLPPKKCKQQKTVRFVDCVATRWVYKQGNSKQQDHLRFNVQFYSMFFAQVFIWTLNNCNWGKYDATRVGVALNKSKLALLCELWRLNYKGLTKLLHLPPDGTCQSRASGITTKTEAKYYIWY